MNELGRTLLVVASVVGGTSIARAAPPERGDALGAPEPGVIRPFAWPGNRPSSPSPDPVPPVDAAAAPDAPRGASPESAAARGSRIPGPRGELAYALYRLSDAYGGGAVHAFQLGGFFPTGVVRLGARGELGVRRIPLTGDDLVVRASLVAGYQHLPREGRRFVPYAAVVLGYGVVIGKRFHTPFARSLAAGGVELGTDVRIATRFAAGLGLLYERGGIGGQGRNLLQLRIRLVL